MRFQGRDQGRSQGQSCSGTDPLVPHTSSLPFLPTLVTAVVLGGLGFLCRPPSEPAPIDRPVSLSQSGIDGFHTSSPADVGAMPVSGLVAFGQQYPLAVAGPGAVASARPAHVAANMRRRCGTGHCETGRTEITRSAANPVRSSEPITTSAIPLQAREAERASPLPGDALPFAPSATAMIDGMRAIGSGAMSLGGSVVGALAELE